MNKHKSAQSLSGESPFDKSHPWLFNEWTAKLDERLRPYLDRAMRHYYKQTDGRCFKRDRGYIETRAEFVVVQAIAYAIAIERPKADATSEFDFSPEGVYRAEREFTAIRPDLDSLRHDVLGRRKPFGTVEAAKAFLRRHGFPGYSPATIEFAGQTTAHDPEFPLGRLAALSARLDRDTPFSQAAIVAFVLMGLGPIPRKYRVIGVKGLPFPKVGSRAVAMTVADLNAFPTRFVDVRIYRPLTDREFKRLAVDSRAMVKRARKMMSAKALEVHRFFEAFGGPPAKGKMVYWERAYNAWQKTHPHSTIKDPEGIRFAYRRLRGFR